MTCSSRISLSVRRRTKIKRLRGSNRGSIHDSCWKKPRRDRCTASPTAPGMAADFVCSRSWCGSRHLGSPQDNGMSAVYATRVSSQRRWRTPRFTGLIVPMFGSRIAEAKRGSEVFGEAEQVAEVCQTTGPRRRELTADRIWCHRLAEAVAECPSVVNEQIDSYAHMQLIQLLNEGKIEFRRVGTHRRVRFEGLIAYQRRADADRRAALAELAAYDQEIGL